jgi:hypothetical protein
MTLDRDDVEAIAQRVAELLRGERPAGYLDARQVAERYGVTRQWVYAHKARLGAVPLGIGPRARLRFDARRVEAVLDEQRQRREPIRRGRPRKPRTPRAPTGVPVLEYERG